VWYSRRIQEWIARGERVYLAYLQGDGRPVEVGGTILHLVDDDALIVRTRTGLGPDRMVVVHRHRLLYLESLSDRLIHLEREKSPLDPSSREEVSVRDFCV